jgi:hypothetical protein
MKFILFGVIASLFVGGGVFLSNNYVGADTYRMSIEDAQKKLMNQNIPKDKIPFKGVDVKISKPQNNQVKWEGQGSYYGLSCTATLSVVAQDQTKVTNSCNSMDMTANDTSQASTVNEITNVGFSEFVKSTLENRPYDDSKVSMQTNIALVKSIPEQNAKIEKLNEDMRNGELDSNNDEDLFEYYNDKKSENSGIENTDFGNPTTILE